MTATPTFNRRDFLARGLKIGSLTLGALAGSTVLEACAQQPRSTSPTSSTTIFLGAPTRSDWTALAASLTGTLILPSNTAYGLDRLLYNSKFTDLHPQAIAYCKSVDDVARCIDFATSHDIALVARSGGHSYGGYSCCPGLVVDVSPMNVVSLDSRANMATVAAGAKLIDVYNTIGAHDRLLPGGSCPSVGIAGLTLGGGIGVFGRKYGLTSDNLRSVSLVTADGQSVTADASNHTDLLWACQGGGGGNFGITTSFAYGVHAMPQVTLFTLQFPWEAAAAMLGGWQQWIAAMPDELWSNCLLLSQGTYGFLAQISGVYCGAPTALNALLGQLTAQIGSSPSHSFTGGQDYVNAMMIEAGCSGLTVAACHLPGQNPNGQLSRAAYSAKSSYVDAPMTTARTELMVQAVVNLQQMAPTLGGGLAFDAYGGAINRVASDATAFVHRDKLACIQATYSWSGSTTSAEIAAGEQWLTWLGSHVFDPSTGAYQNYIDPALADWKTAYYGSNLDRLSEVKRKFDPDNVFNFAQSIPRST